MSENPIVQQSQPAAIEIHAARRGGGGLVPTTFSEMWRLSRVLVASGMLPKDMKTEAQVFTAMQLGAEIGLSPMVSCQSIAVINGRPSVWGDVAIGLVQASGFLADFQEEEIYDGGKFVGYRCTGKRTNRPSPVSHTWTIDDSKQAKLIPNHPDSPWTKYPKRMCQMRARGFTLRDLFPDVLKGLVLPEEAEDMAPIDVTPAAVERIAETTADRLRSRLSAPALKLEAATPFDDPAEVEDAPARENSPQEPVSEAETTEGTGRGRKRSPGSAAAMNTAAPEQSPAQQQPPETGAPPEAPQETGEVAGHPPDLGSILPTEEELPRSNFGRSLMTRYKQLSNVLRSTGEKDPDGRAAAVVVQTMGNYGATTWAEVPAGSRPDFIKAIDTAIQELVDAAS